VFFGLEKYCGEIATPMGIVFTLICSSGLGID